RASPPGDLRRTSTDSARSPTCSKPSSEGARSRDVPPAPPRVATWRVPAGATPRKRRPGPGGGAPSRGGTAGGLHRGQGAARGPGIETCERGGGSGQLQATPRTPFGQMVRAVTCEACHGEGRLPADPCRECRGRGRRASKRGLDVEVPAGISDGQRIRLTGRGHAGEMGAPAGDLYLLVRVRDDERFVREGDDLITALDVPAPLAALGGTLEAPTLDGATQVELAPGTQPGEVLSLRGRGMPALGRRRRGDLRVIVNVVIPRRLTEEQRELLERLSGSLTAENLRSGESMFTKLRRALGSQAA